MKHSVIASRLSDPRCQEKADRSIERSPPILIDEVRRPRSEAVRVLFAAGRFVASLFRRWPAARESRQP